MASRIEAVADILSLAFDILGVSSDEEMLVGRCGGDLMVSFRGCAIGFGRGGFFLGASPRGFEEEEVITNTELLIDFFTTSFGEPLPWSTGDIPVWPIGEIDTCYIEAAVGLVGGRIEEVFISGPRIIN